MKKLPELLAPAGTPEALAAALDAGADAIYFGGTDFNARLRAANFTPEAMRDAVKLCHAYGARAYLTLNTLVTDRELPRAVEAAKEAYLCGIDALIVADLGAAAAIQAALPDFELHASTQCAGHNTAAAAELKKLGFSRMVIARETSREDMQRFLAESDLELEVFVHGALCVSHSGQCLFSSLVGGRSGNRGECAQPCRLPDASGKYPLSLKDLSLAEHVPELIEMGVHSLKIEGRLKSPEYVREVVSVWRRLLDERRAATKAEMAHLGSVFSRGGFTDAYFKGRTGRDMMGYRSDDDKQNTRELAPFTGITRKVPLAMHLTMKRDLPLSLTVTAGEKTATVTADAPLVAERAPMDAEMVKKNLCKLGNTPYTPERVEISLDEGLMVPVSRLNTLRREALEKLCEVTRTLPAPIASKPQKKSAEAPVRSARFEHAAQITKAATEYFPIRYLPLHAYDQAANGVVIPPVIFDHERVQIKAQLQKARDAGAAHALVGNIGHLAIAIEAGLIPHADFRLNITNTGTLDTVLSLGFVDALLSPELTLPQIRDIHGARDAIVYGRIPLMLLEKCAGQEVGTCEKCDKEQNALVDRRREKFPILRLPPHRNILLNSRPTAMSDRRAELARAGINAGHYIFTIESPAEVNGTINAYQTGTPLQGAVRRI
jgi:putative protease